MTAITEPATWLKQQAKRSLGLLLSAVGAGLGVGICTIVITGLIAWLVSQVLTQDALLATLWPPLISLALLIGLRALLQAGQELCAAKASIRIRQAVRAQIIAHVQQLGPVYSRQWTQGHLANSVVEEVEALDGYFARFLPQLALALLIPALILLLAVQLDWLVALILLLAMPLIPLFMALIGMGAERLNREQFLAVARLSGHFLDRVRGLSTLQLLGQTEASTAQVWQHAEGYRLRSMRTLRIAFLSSAVLEFFASMAIAVVAIYIGFGLLGYINYGPSAELSLFTGLWLLLLAPEFFQPLRSLAQHYHDRATALGAAQGLLAILQQAARPSTTAAAQSKPIANSTPNSPPAIELDNICVHGRHLDLSLTIQAGECLVITGESGAGKSTLLQLLAGFIQPDQGQIIHPATLWPMAWLDQSPLLISASLADNLRLAAPKASDAELMAALQQAGLGELLAQLPTGLETPIGERAYGLSGGQAQRLALARIFLSPAPLLLLDEPTAHLDQDTEAAVIRALQNWLRQQQRTVVIASHHPAILSLASRTLHLEAGKISAYTTTADATPAESPYASVP